MAGFIECIQKKADEGLLSKVQVAKLEQRYTELLGRYSRNMSDANAAERAAARVVEIEGEKLAKKKRNEIQHVIRTNEIQADIKRLGVPVDKYARDLYESTYIRRQVVEKDLLSYLDEFGQEFNENILGTSRNLEGIEDVVREAMGESTGNSTAARIGKAIKETFHQGHARYEAAGGILGYIENYFPIIHKKEPIKAVGFEQWAKDIKSHIDRSAMIGVESGLPISDEGLDLILEGHYKAIVEGDSSELDNRINRGIANVSGVFRTETDIRRDLSRFYKWKSPSNFIEYNSKYGTGTEGLYGVIPHYISTLARDISLMEKISPRPQAMFKNLDAMMGRDKVSAVKRRWTNGMYNVLSGAVDGWDGDQSHWYKALAGTQNYIRSAVLGAASLSASTDSAYIVATSRLNGMSATRSLKRYFSLLNPLSDTDRKLAKRNGYIVELIQGSALKDTRFAGESLESGKITQWLAGFTNKFSGLASMTKANMDAISLEAEATLGELVRDKVTWDNLDSNYRAAAEAHGISAKDWEYISKVQPFEHPDSGAVFLRSRDIADSAQGSAERAAALEGEVLTRNKGIQESSKKKTDAVLAARTKLEEIDTIIKGNPDADKKSLKKLVDGPKKELSAALKELGITARKTDKITSMLDDIENASIQSYKNATIELQGAKEFGTRQAQGEAFKEAKAIANKLDDWIYTMRQATTNEPSLRAKSITTGAAFVSDPRDAKKGTVLRAMASSGFMFKSFLLTNLFTHMMPSISRAWEGVKTRDASKLEYLASILVGTTVFGAAAIHMKDLSKGREFRNMDDSKFWKAAVLQGGGFGIFSDFLFSDYSRFGRSPLVEALGPVAGLGSDLYDIAKGNFDKAVDEVADGKSNKDVNLLRDLFKLSKRNIPAVNLWYSRLIIERVFLDQIEKTLDPRAQTKWLKSENRFFRDTGQKLYWRRGELTPR